MSTDPEHIAYEAWIDQHPLAYPGIEYDAFVAGYRAALQSQDRDDNGEWMRRFIELLDEFGYESARYAHPCATGRSWLDKIRSDTIDHARRVEGDGE